ncbi:hypothetical protein AAMO2058_000427100 [Amorphochlora amoebiformis]
MFMWSRAARAEPPPSCPMHSSKTREKEKESCPVAKSQSAEAMMAMAKSGQEKEKLNSSNQMPEVSQRPMEGQRRRLSTYRVESTIPKGEYQPSHQLEGKETWTYPSPQQFYNAMKRKGYTPNEADMNQVVAIHNTVNEKTWEKVMEWESLHLNKCPNPRLEKFSGKANDLSSKARIMTWLGYTAPFDRHDWVVDRCGTKVRYIIDFYTGTPMAGMPISMHLDVRPAPDSAGAVMDHVRMMGRSLRQWIFG